MNRGFLYAIGALAAVLGPEFIKFKAISPTVWDFLALACSGIGAVAVALRAYIDQHLSRKEEKEQNETEANNP